MPKQTRADRIVPARRPPVPAAQGPGTSVTPFTLSSLRLAALDGKDTELYLTSTNDRLVPMFKGLLEAVSELGIFFAPAVCDGYKEDDIWDLMRMYGRWRLPSEPLSQGDLAQLGPGPNGHWVLVLAAKGWDVSEAISIERDGADFLYLRVAPRNGRLGTARRAWMPSTGMVLNPQSQIGRFWGTNLGELRAILYDHAGSWTLPHFLEHIFETTRYDASSFEAVMQVLEPELYVLDDPLPRWPGSLVLTERDGELGIILADGMVLGIRNKPRQTNTVEYLAWDEFAPKYIWYPHP